MVITTGTRRRASTGALLAAVLAVVGCAGASQEATTAASPAAPSTGGDTTTTSPAVPSIDTETTAPPTEAGTPKPSSEEFQFRSDGFDLVGTLHLPAGTPPHGALIMVHGSGPQTRDSIPTSGLVKRRFLDAGYAVLSWDKPGSGESTGDFDPEYGNTQRATILADAIEELAHHSAVNPDRIGLWGLSEAGWVMPQALTMTDRVAFMIVVSGGGEDSIEQQVYQWTQKARCGGATPDEVAVMGQYGAPALKATSYDEYHEAMEQLLTISNLDNYIGVDIEIARKDDWRPWPREIDAFFDPIDVIEHTTIPVLAIFAEHDIQIDAIQGADAYEAALQRADNTESRVETIPAVSHTLQPTTSDGCTTTGSNAPRRYLEIIDEWIESLQDR